MGRRQGAESSEFIRARKAVHSGPALSSLTWSNYHFAMNPRSLSGLLFAGLAVCAGRAELPTVTVTGDDTRITQSCRIVIPPNMIISDVNNNGVLQIAASNITVEFESGSVLRGAAAGLLPDTYAGFGIRIEGQSGVTLRAAKVQGFLCGIRATRTDGLVIENADVSDIRRQHLRSTPAAEDGADWLWPHRNDEHEWVRNYGGAICVENSANVTVRRCRVRTSQNGLLLDRVRDSKVYDNDCSFLSGWGLAMWRSTKNVVSRNAFDFCIRGYSHGVYNRGQDSAGILFFEQNNENVIAENSATHGGDGFFGFAGREAIGENWLDEQREKLRKETGKQDVDELIKADDAAAAGFKRKGCNDNLIINNDFSYAAAHGIELTFSFGNRLIGNRLAGNAICGVWGGYSQSTLIALNQIEENGGAGYGLERGGINIEHGTGNTVVENKFRANAVGVHFWGGANGNFDQRPWGKANGSASAGNLIAENEFAGDEMALHFRGPGDVALAANQLSDVKTEMKADPVHEVQRSAAIPRELHRSYRDIGLENPGSTKPVGARKALAGRENIIMTEWGPWDHETALVRCVQQSGPRHIYELRHVPAGTEVEVSNADLSRSIEPLKSGDGRRLTLEAPRAGVFPYQLRIHAGDAEIAPKQGGTLVSTRWTVVFFPWEVDPRKDLEGWRKLSDGAEARRIETDSLTFKYAGGGPKNLRLSSALSDSKIGADHFGMIARTKIPLTKGKWNLKTLSDDGVRVLADGKPIIENWAWHGPTTDNGTLTLDADREVEFVVEHFEIDGYAVLDFDLAPAP